MTSRCGLCLLLFSLWIGAAGAGSASAEFIEEFRTRLYAVQTSEAVSVARARLAAAPHDVASRWAPLSFCKPSSNLGRVCVDTVSNRPTQMTFGLTGLPFLRLPVPDNPKPDALTYDAIPKVLATFVANLSAAEATLGQIRSEEGDLPLNIGLIRLDLDADVA